MVTVEAPEGITTFSQPRYLPVPLGDQTLPSTLPLKLAPGLLIATVMFISLLADGFVGVIVTLVMEDDTSPLTVIEPLEIVGVIKEPVSVFKEADMRLRLVVPADTPLNVIFASVAVVVPTA